MLRFGKITEVDPAKGLAKVTFDEFDGLVSKWWPMAQPKTGQDKFIIPFDINEHVYCIADENCDDGVICGAIYDANNVPDGGAAGKIRAKFVPNMLVEYDRQTSTLTINGTGELNVQIGTSQINVKDGILIKRDSETLKKIIDDLISEIKNIIVPTNVGPSGKPINAAAFDAIKTRADNLLK